MSDEPNLSGAEEYISAEIDLAHELDPEQEKNLRAALEKRGGVRRDSLSLSGQRITVYYDPAQMTQDELVALIQQAGAQMSDVQTQRAPAGS